MQRCVRTENQALTLDLMIDAPGPIPTPLPVLDVCIPLFLYPIDKFLSSYVAIWASFDPNLEIQWGPVGALAGVTLPWVTLIPYLYPPHPLADVDLDPQVFDELRQRVHESDGVDAYIELVKKCGWPGACDALHSVRMAEEGP